MMMITHLIDAKHRDQVLNTRRTVCGLVGYVQVDRLEVAGQLSGITGRPAFVTCEKCRPPIGELTAAMVRMLEAIADAGGSISTKTLNQKQRWTYRALWTRGLVDRGRISDSGSLELAKRKAKQS